MTASHLNTFDPSAFMLALVMVFLTLGCNRSTSPSTTNPVNQSSSETAEDPYIGLASDDSTTPSTTESTTTSRDSEPASHLPTKAMDLPERFKMESQNGMSVTVGDHEHGVDLLLAFGGYRHVSGAVRWTRIMVRFPRGKDVLSLSDCKAIYYDANSVKHKTIDCLNGYVVLDRDAKKVEIDWVVFDDEDWHMFDWNGVWKAEFPADFDVDEILETWEFPIRCRLRQNERRTKQCTCGLEMV